MSERNENNRTYKLTKLGEDIMKYIDKVKPEVQEVIDGDKLLKELSQYE